MVTYKFNALNIFASFVSIYNCVIAKKNTWTKENCIAYAKQCSTKKEFRENNGAYFACMRNKWLDEVYSYI